jgi:hypothetical protein
MQSRDIVLVVALTLPLALYGIPYAYATTVGSTYTKYAVGDATAANPNITVKAACNSGDYATGGAGIATDPHVVVQSYPTAGGTGASLGQTPDGWAASFADPVGVLYEATIYVVCQTPITVGGVGVPEFGSFYAAIALGAMVYFLISRHSNRGPEMSASVQA